MGVRPQYIRGPTPQGNWAPIYPQSQVPRYFGLLANFDKDIYAIVGHSQPRQLANSCHVVMDSFSHTDRALGEFNASKVTFRTQQHTRCKMATHRYRVQCGIMNERDKQATRMSICRSKTGCPPGRGFHVRKAKFSIVKGLAVLPCRFCGGCTEEICVPWQASTPEFYVHYLLFCEYRVCLGQCEVHSKKGNNW